MKWSRGSQEQWMENCYLCGGRVAEEVRASLERHYACVRRSCGARFRLSLRYPQGEKKRGSFACLVMAPSLVLKEALHGFLYEELCAACPACGTAFVDCGDGTLVCSGGACDASAELYLERLYPPFVALLVVMRIGEPWFSQALSNSRKHHRYN